MAIIVEGMHHEWHLGKTITNMFLAKASTCTRYNPHSFFRIPKQQHIISHSWHYPKHSWEPTPHPWLNAWNICMGMCLLETKHPQSTTRWEIWSSIHHFKRHEQSDEENIEQRTTKPCLTQAHQVLRVLEESTLPKNKISLNVLGNHLKTCRLV
mgnify:CR=1 FL=1